MALENSWPNKAAWAVPWAAVQAPAPWVCWNQPRRPPLQPSPTDTFTPAPSTEQFLYKWGSRDTQYSQSPHFLALLFNILLPFYILPVENQSCKILWIISSCSTNRFLALFFFCPISWEVSYNLGLWLWSQNSIITEVWSGKDYKKSANFPLCVRWINFSDSWCMFCLVCSLKTFSTYKNFDLFLDFISMPVIWSQSGLDTFGRCWDGNTEW